MSTQDSEYTCPAPAPLPLRLTLCNGYISCARALVVFKGELALTGFIDKE